MSDIQTINGSVRLDSDPTSPTLPLGVFRTDAGMTSSSKSLAQINMFGAGLNNLQGVMSFTTANSGAANAAPAERMRIDVTGCVGIGTAVPLRKLHVHSDTVPGSEIHASGATAGFSFTDREAGRVYDDGHPGERWVWYSSGRTARFWTSGIGDVLSIENNGQTRTWGPYMIATGLGGEQCYIGGDGSGNDAQIGSMNPSVTNLGVWNGGNSTWMSVLAARYVTLSDASLKTNVVTISDALTKVRKLRGVSFDWAKDKGPAGKHIGLIAQEVAEIAPEAVIKDSKGNLGIAYGQLVSILIEATKELEARLSKVEGDSHKTRTTR